MKMRNFILLLLSISFIEAGCKKDEEPVIEKDSTPNGLWRDYYNNSIEKIDSFYYSNAIIIQEDSKVVKGKQQIKDYYSSRRKQLGKIKSIKTLYEKKDILSTNIKYQIGSFTTVSDEEYSFILISSKVKDTTYIREIEVVVKSENSADRTDSIKTRKTDWLKGANGHNLIFVDNLYYKDAVYYQSSASALFQGVSNIKSAYNYMQNEGYNLSGLSSYYIKQINSRFIFEIGKYYGDAGTGDYALVWMLCEDNVWRIFLDSNY